MSWLLIIIMAFAAEFLIRFMTRDMEDKKKREKMLSLLWVALGVVLLLIWLFTK